MKTNIEALRYEVKVLHAQLAASKDRVEVLIKCVKDISNTIRDTNKALKDIDTKEKVTLHKHRVSHV